MTQASDREDSGFWEKLQSLVDSSTLGIDRPRGSCHPRYPELVYPHDYGYLEGTSAMDGGGIDVWVGTLLEKSVTGVVCTVDLKKRDAEVKILLGCTPDEMREILAFHDSGPMGGILVERPAGRA